MMKIAIQSSGKRMVLSVKVIRKTEYLGVKKYETGPLCIISFRWIIDIKSFSKTITILEDRIVSRGKLLS